MITQETYGTAGWREMISLRQLVLRTPLGLTYSEEQLSAEQDQIHLALQLGEKLVGTVLLVQGAVGRLRQMAIDPAYAGQGFGRTLVGAAEQRLGGLGSSEIVLSARASATGFYTKLGYRPEGEPYVEVTIPHCRMRKQLGG